MKKNSRKVLIVTWILVVIVILVVCVVVVMKNNQWFGREEVTKTANGGKADMLADTYEDATENKKSNPDAETKKKIMEELSKGWDYSKVTAVEVKISSNNTDGSESNVVNSEKNGETETMKIPVPVGYTASQIEGENTVDGGFVIYEGSESVTSDNKETAQKERNQWVWVPVYNPSDMYGVDSNGKMCGKLYNFDSNGRTNDNWSEKEGKINITSKTGDREPDLLSSYDKDDYLSRYLSETDKEQLGKELKNTFEKTIESIKKYGGFYIGRYETGGLNGTAKVVKGDTDISSQTWYTMYEKCKALKGENRNVETSMIWGCQWDRTLQWLVDTKTKEYKDVGLDSIDWGNFLNKKLTYTDENGSTKTKNQGSKVWIPSGSSEATKANNIYDMAGNIWDRTLEAYGTDYRRNRGGCYYNINDCIPADYRGSISPDYSGGPSYSNGGIRVSCSTLRSTVS